MIKEIYSLYNKILNYDKDYPNPNNWRDPPQYCYKDLLIDMVKELKEKLKQHKSKSKTKTLTLPSSKSKVVIKQKR